MRKGWISEWDGSGEQLDKIRSQALRGGIWVVFYGDTEHRIFATGKEAEEWAAEKWPPPAPRKKTRLVVKFLTDTLRSKEGYDLTKVKVR